MYAYDFKVKFSYISFNFNGPLLYGLKTGVAKVRNWRKSSSKFLQ